MTSMVRKSRWLALALAGVSAATPGVADVPVNGGPYNARILAGGIGVERALERADALVAAGAPYTLSTWVRPDARQSGEAVLIRLGSVDNARSLSLVDGRLVLHDGGAQLRGTAVPTGRWTHVAAVSDGNRAVLYVDGHRVAAGSARSVVVAPVIAIAPAGGAAHFGGQLVDAKADGAASSASAIAAAVRA